MDTKTENIKRNQFEKDEKMKKHQFISLVLLVLVIMPTIVHATTTTGGGLPWESPLQTFRDSITGPVALAIAVLAIAVAGAMLIFGGEINNFARMCCFIILVAGLLVSANNVLSTLYGSGAVVPSYLAAFHGTINVPQIL